MGLTEMLARLEAEEATLREQVDESLIRLRGIEVEIAAVRSRLSPDSGLAGMSRTDAILEVLRQASGTMTPTELVERLRDADRDEHLRSVTATLNHLMAKKLVKRPARGRYLAA